MTDTCRVVDIAIDVGTSVLKVAAVDGEERVLAQGRADIPLLRPSPGAALQDVQVIEHLLRGLLQALADDLGETHRVDKIAWSSAMHSLLLVDAKGAPLGPAYTWLDGRAAAVARDCWDHGPGRNLYGRTGTPIHPLSPLIKLRWLRQTGARDLAAARHILSIKEWLWWRSFGNYEVDYATASASGVLDIHRGDWSAAALAYAGVDAEQLSKLVTREWQRPLRREDPIFPPQWAGACACLGASDGVLAQWGMGALTEDILGVSLGTSMAVRRYSPLPRLSRRTRNFAYRVDDHHWLVGTASNNGGPMLDWVRRYSFGADVGFTEALAAAARATHRHCSACPSWLASALPCGAPTLVLPSSISTPGMAPPNSCTPPWKAFFSPCAGCTKTCKGKHLAPHAPSSSAVTSFTQPGLPSSSPTSSACRYG